MGHKVKITITDRFLFNLINSYSVNKKPFFGSNAYLSKELNKSQSVISHSISRLVKQGYIINTGNKMVRQLFTTEKTLLNTSVESADFNKESADFNKESADFNFFFEEFKKELAKNSNNKMLKTAIESAENSNILIKRLISYTNSKVTTLTDEEKKPNGYLENQKVILESKKSLNVNDTVNKYRFNGKVIKLTQKDFDKWLELFPNLNLEAELYNRDLWLEKQNVNLQCKWFQSTSSWFAKIDKEREPLSENRKIKTLCEKESNRINRPLHGFEKQAIEEGRKVTSKLEIEMIKEWCRDNGYDETIC